MAFPFIYVAIIFGWILLVLGFYYKNYAITLISSFFIMIIGIHILVSGIEGLYSWSNLAIEGMGFAHIGIGAIVSFTKGIEFIQAYL